MQLLGLQAARGRKAKQRWKPSNLLTLQTRISFPMLTGRGHHWGMAGNPVSKASQIQSFHMLVSTPQNFQLAILEELRSLFPGIQGCWEETGPLNPRAPALGVVYFSSGCQSQQKQQWLPKPLNTHSPADPTNGRQTLHLSFSIFSPTYLKYLL